MERECMRVKWTQEHMSKSTSIALTVPCGNVLKTGESSRAPILTVAPPRPTTTYLFLEAEGAERAYAREGTKVERQTRVGGK